MKSSSKTTVSSGVTYEHCPPTVFFFLPVQLLSLGTFQVKVVNLTSCFPFPSILSGVGNSNADCFGPEIHLRAHCIAFNQIFTVINLSWHVCYEYRIVALEILFY